MIIKKLEHQFIINYLIIFSIIIFLGIFVFLFTDAYEESQDYRFSVDIVSLVEDYDTMDLNKAAKINGFLEKDYIEVLNLNYEVIDSYQSPNKIGIKYSVEEYQNFFSPENTLYYITYYDEINNKIFLFYLNPVEINNLYLQGIIVFLILMSIASMIFARMTAKKIIIPIKKLINGVNKIEKGIYDNEISFKASKELNLLKESINKLSKQLQNEIKLRKLSEENKEQLIANLSHDIKTPLTNILGYSESLLLENNINPSIKKDLKIINEYGKIANNLTEQLFEFTRISIDNSHKQKKVLNINIFFENKYKQYTLLFSKKNISFDLIKNNAPLLVEINKQQFSRAIDNLIDNAIKYNDSFINIDIEVAKENNFAKIVIKDNGIGIKEKWHSSIFDPTTRVDNSRHVKSGGTGLGLAITKKIINKHNGKIIIDSSYKDGCKFIIHLPLKKH